MAAATHNVAAALAPVSLRLGSYCASVGTSPEIRAMALELRGQAFRRGGSDEDVFDAESLHGVVVLDHGQPRVAFRARLLQDPADLDRCYTGQVYDLAPLRAHPGPYLELGRFCQCDGPTDVMAMRLAWAVLGSLVDNHQVRFMIGCTSFSGADPELHRRALGILRARHMGPDMLRPNRLSPEAIDLPMIEGQDATLPPLLRSYLSMGGWVSDHAVCDPQLDTVHVFTGLDVNAIPEARKARLRALAQAARTGTATPLDLGSAAP